MENVKREYLISMFLIGVGIFITPLILRQNIISNDIYLFNFLTWCGYIGILSLNNSQNTDIKGTTTLTKSTVRSICIFISIICILCVGMPVYEEKKYIYKVCLTIVCPIFLIFLKIKDVDSIPQIFKVWVKIINFSVGIITICGIGDLLFSNYFSAYFVQIYKVQSLYSMLKENRMVSYIGHSLLTAEIYIIYFISNYLYVKYLKKNKYSNIYIIIAFLGIALTGSKVNIAILVIMTIMLKFKVSDMNNKRKLRGIILTSIVIYCFYKIGIFNNLIFRIQQGMATGDLSTGRNVNLINLYESGEIKFQLFKGQRINLTQSMIIALEYPMLRMAYRYGIVFSVYIGIIIFVYPLVKVIKRKQWDVLVCLLGLIVCVNSYDSIAGITDAMLIYCSTVFIILNFSINLFNSKSLNEVKEI